jgi:hypothetical protein
MEEAEVSRARCIEVENKIKVKKNVYTLFVISWRQVKVKNIHYMHVHTLKRHKSLCKIYKVLSFNIEKKLNVIFTQFTVNLIIV